MKDPASIVAVLLFLVPLALLAAMIQRLRGDAGAGELAIARARAVASPEVVAPALAAVYGD